MSGSGTKITRRKFLLGSVAGTFVLAETPSLSLPDNIDESSRKKKSPMKKIISTPNAPAAIGPYSQAVMINGFLYTSGQIAIDPSTGNMVQQDIQAETHQVMKNLKAILTEAGLDFTHVVKTGIFLQRMSDFQTVNEVYASYFSSDFPARETVEVAALPKGANVEISMVAVKG